MKIQFDLLANATDSISQAIELLAWKDERDEASRLKRAVLAVAHGVELLLKERLRRVHPVLIWENVDKFPNLSARTVTVDSAVGRLVRVGGLQFRDDDLQLITSLRDTRNAIEHYVWTTTKAEADRIVGRALGFALHFAETELHYDFFGYGSHRDSTLQDLKESNPDFAKALVEQYAKANSETLVEDQSMICSYCHARAVHPSTGACRLCGHWNSLDDGIPF